METPVPPSCTRDVSIKSFLRVPVGLMTETLVSSTLSLFDPIQETFTANAGRTTIVATTRLTRAMAHRNCADVPRRHKTGAVASNCDSDRLTTSAATRTDRAPGIRRRTGLTVGTTPRDCHRDAGDLVGWPCPTGPRRCLRSSVRVAEVIATRAPRECSRERVVCHYRFETLETES